MTIKELCKKHINCSVCPYLPICGDAVCPYLPICGDKPENYNLGTDLKVTNAIIQTAKALEQEPITSTCGVTNKIAEFFSNWDGDESAKMEISVNDMRKISSMFATKCRAESELKALEQHNIDKLISKLEDEKFKLYNDDIHCGFDGGLERAKQIVKEFYEAQE